MKSNKQVAHLTCDRIHYEESGKEWDLVQIVADIMKSFRAVAPIFPDTKLSDSFRQFISRPDLLVPLVGANPVYSAEGQSTGITFLVNISRTGEVMGIGISA